MSTEPQLTSTGKKKFIPKLYINLGRCRYDVIRDVAEEMGMSVDFDDEDLASTMTKTIQQPQRSTTTTAAVKKTPPLSTALHHHQSSISSNLSLLTNVHRQPATHLHDQVYKMIESRRAHIMWSDVTITQQQLSSCAVWQRLNHFPGISQTLSRKVPLGHTMMRAWKLSPEHFGELIPLSFSLKKDTPVLRQYFEEVEFSKKLKKRSKQQQQSKKNPDDGTENIVHDTSTSQTVATMSPTNPFKNTKVFIFKPNAGCMGHDIKLTCRPLQMMQKLLTGTNVKFTKHIKEDEDFVCQSYIDRPMLIEKKKFDLRVYVLLLGVTPDLRILIHDEGLVRICATEYVEPKASNVRKSTMHLTNYAVNKKTLKTKEKNSSEDRENSSRDALDDQVDEEDDDEENENNNNEDTASSSPPPEIDGIKRDFKFFNSMLDRDYSSLGGAAEIWRRIDRAIVMSLIAAHPELDRMYRQASAGNQVLLKRTAQTFLKDVKIQKEEEAREQEQEMLQSNEKKNEEHDDDDDVRRSEKEKDKSNIPSDQEDEDENEDDAEANEATAKKQSSSLTSILENITSEEEFIENCCIGRSCFELLGFDLLLTETGHPYIMEVNHGPSLETGADIDLRIKSKVLRDTFNHVSVFLPNSTKKAHLRARRYLQKIVRRGGLHPMMDLEKSEKYKTADSGYRIAYPLVGPFQNEAEEKLSREYEEAKKIISSSSSTSSPSSVLHSPNEEGITISKQGSRTNSAVAGKLTASIHRRPSFSTSTKITTPNSSSTTPALPRIRNSSTSVVNNNKSTPISSNSNSRTSSKAVLQKKKSSLSLSATATASSSSVLDSRVARTMRM